MNYKEFDVRWNDIDANRHLANSAYLNFMSHTRMGYMIENGVGHKEMVQYNICLLYTSPSPRDRG